VLAHGGAVAIVMLLGAISASLVERIKVRRLRGRRPAA